MATHDSMEIILEEAIEKVSVIVYVGGQLVATRFTASLQERALVLQYLKGQDGAGAGGTPAEMKLEDLTNISYGALVPIGVSDILLCANIDDDGVPLWVNYPAQVLMTNMVTLALTLLPGYAAGRILVANEGLDGAHWEDR